MRAFVRPKLHPPKSWNVQSVSLKQVPSLSKIELACPQKDTFGTVLTLLVADRVCLRLLQELSLPPNVR